MTGIWFVVGLYALPLLFCLAALAWRLICAVKLKRDEGRSEASAHPPLAGSAG